jgi:type IX secretion system substrate protein
MICIMKKSTLKFLAIAMFFFMGTFVMAQTQYEITFQVDMTDADPFDPATDEIFMSGSFAGWAQPGSDVTYKMEPLEVGSMLYTLTATIDSGEVQYKYFRIIDGAASWDNGEWTGEDNRIVYPTGATEYANMWANRPVVVTFIVDMTDADPFNPTTDAVYIAGTLANGWTKPGEISAYMMTPLDAEPMKYGIDLSLYVGDYAYKYFRVIDEVPSWDNGEDIPTDRTVTVDTLTTDVMDVWSDIEAGIFGEPNEFTYSMYPNPVVTLLNIGNTSDVSQVEVFDITGKLVRTVEVASVQQVTIDVAELQTGVYIVNVRNDKGIQTSKFVKN